MRGAQSTRAGVRRPDERQGPGAPAGRWHGLGWLLPVVLAAGCARFEPRPLSPADTAAALESRSLTNTTLKAYLESTTRRDYAAWPLAQWDLDDLTRAAFYYQPDLEVARAQWQTARGETRTAAGRPNPTVNFGPGYNSSAVSGVNPWMPFVTFDWTFETAGKRARRMEQAEHLAEAARLNIAASAWQVRSALRSSLLDSLAAHQREGLLRRQNEVQEKITARLQQRLDSGAITRSDLTLARVALEKTRLDLNDAQRQGIEARSRVAGTVGVPLSALDDVELTLGPPPAPAAVAELTSAELRRLALVNRADILGALAGYEASQSALQLEIARQYPDLHINPGYVWDQGESKWTLGIGLELPVLNRNQGPIAAAQARRAETAAKFIALQAKVLAEIDRSAALVRVTQTNLATVDALDANLRTERESIEAQRRAGVADEVDLLNAQLEYEVNQLVRLDARLRFEQAVGALEDAVQRPLSLPALDLQSTTR